jgi:hypothetical protein
MPTTVTELLRAIGPPTLVPWAVPAGVGDLEVRDLVIHDRTAPGEVARGTVVLAVGLDEAETESLVRRAGQDGVAAVVTRPTATDHRRRLVDAAEHAGVGLLALSSSIGWADCATLLRNAVATSGEHLSDSHLDLTGVANDLAAAVNGSVLVFNPQQEILAFSRLRPEDDLMRRQAIADQRGPVEYREHLRSLGVYRRLWGGADVVDIAPVAEFDANRRLAIAIRAGEEILGSIWVAEGGEPLSADAADILRSAAASASGHLAWLSARAQTQRRFAEGLVGQLLLGDADVAAVAGWLGVPADGRCVVVLVATDDPGMRRRLADQLVLHFSAFRSTPLVTVLHDAVALVLVDLGEGGEALATLPDTLVRVGRGLDLALLGAIGDVEDSLRHLPRSRRAAEQALAALRTRVPAGETRVADTADVRTHVRMDELLCWVRESADDLRGGPAGRLVAWDAEHGTDYASSVLAFLAAHGSVAEAAERTHVHPNTVRYRLRRAEELAGLGLDDPDARLVVHLELSALLSDPTAGRSRTWGSA